MGRFSWPFLGFVTHLLCGDPYFFSGTADQPFLNSPDVTGFGWPTHIKNVSMKYLPHRDNFVKHLYAYGFYFNKSCARFCCNTPQHIKSQDTEQAVQCHKISKLNEGKMNLTSNKNNKSYVIPRNSNVCVMITATTETKVTYFYSNLTEDYPHNKSEIAVFTPKNPKPYGFGLPVPFLFNVTMNTIPIEGMVQYDLLMGGTCPPDPTDLCCVLVVIPWCQRIVNQNCSSVQEEWNCTICNTTVNCTSMGISRDHQVCFALKVTTSVGVIYSQAIERSYLQYVFIFWPPKNVRLLVAGKGILTAVWDSPDGVDNDTLQNTAMYAVILKDANGSCASTTETLPATGMIWNHSYSFTALKAWSRYSVTICWGLVPGFVDKEHCTCHPRHQLAGPVFQRTLPEAPSDQPQWVACEASCDSKQMSLTLKWQTSEKHEWNGIPRNSLIRIWNVTSNASDSTGAKESELGTPMLFNISLESNYTYTIANLDSQLSYLVKIQFCSTGGCSLNSTKRRVDCNSCGSVIDRPRKRSQVPDSQGSYGTEIGVGVSMLVSLLLVLVVAVVKTRKRKRIQSLQDRIGTLDTPHVYDEANQADMTGEEGPYSEVFTDTSPLLVMAERASTPEPQWI